MRALSESGKVTITANQSGDEIFLPAESLKKLFYRSAPVLTKTPSGNGVLLSSSYSSGRRWYRNGELLVADTLSTCLASYSGIYTAKVFIDGCESGFSKKLIVNTSNVNDADANVNIAPNPTPDFVRVDFRYPGVKEVTSKESLQLDVRNYRNGIYILEIQSASGISTHRFIKRWSWTRRRAAIVALHLSWNTI